MLGGNSFDEDRIEIRIPCKPEYVRTVRRAVAEFASLNMPDWAVEEVEIAASEAVSNVIRHAYESCKDAPPVRVKCAQSRDRLTIEVIDRGCGFEAPPRSVIPEVDLDKEGGLGIVLIKNFMDHVSYVSKPGTGTRIRMTKRCRNRKAERSSDDGQSVKDPSP